MLSLFNGKFLFIIRNIYHIHLVCEQHNLFYEGFLLSTAQKVHTTWVTVNKHGGSTPRGKKWTRSKCVFIMTRFAPRMCTFSLYAYTLKVVQMIIRVHKLVLKFCLEQGIFIQCVIYHSIKDLHKRLRSFSSINQNPFGVHVWFYLIILIGYVVSVCLSYG